MRSDMTRLLVLRGKGGKRWAMKPARKKNDCDYGSMPKRAAMGRGYRQKHPEEYLSPLKRLLQKRVGRRWNDVYSEIREYLKLRKAVHLHVLEHLEDMVVPLAWIEDGVLVSGRAKHRRVVQWSRWCTCYVDEGGILREIPPGRRARRRSET